MSKCFIYCLLVFYLTRPYVAQLKVQLAATAAATAIRIRAAIFAVTVISSNGMNIKQERA